MRRMKIMLSPTFLISRLRDKRRGAVGGRGGGDRGNA